MPDLIESAAVPGPARRVPPWVPAAFFVAGFAWDAVTLGRAIRPVDLFVLLGYLCGAAIVLVLLGREVVFRGSRYLAAGLQFFFGGVLSALFIFYFLSSSGLAGLLFVAALAVLLIGNELLEHAYGKLTLSWTLFTLSAIMFLNFALAHLFRSISTFWFYAGTLVAVLVVIILSRTAKQDSASVKPSFAVAALMLALHAMNVIPPVPLVKKEMLIAHDLRRSGGTYVASVESPRWRLWRSSAATFHRRSEEPVYCFTSVFVPVGIRTTIRHRWEVFDKEADGWITTSLVPFTIAGGREGGYRGYTFKKNVSAGLWRVTAESESGAAIGILQFRIVQGTPERMVRRRL